MMLCPATIRSRAHGCHFLAAERTLPIILAAQAATWRLDHLEVT